jgi:NAD+ synthase (glutamine-hydrolysing)
MEIRNHATNMVMHPNLREALENCRKQRGFNLEGVIEAKIKLLNDYYRQAGLKSAVVAVSGGIDSAVVLGLVEMASRAEDSPIEHIVAITMPDTKNKGVTGQDVAAELAFKVCEHFDIEPLEINMSPIVREIHIEAVMAVGQPKPAKERWCKGQSTSYARTATYYYVTSILSAQDRPGLVIGTTNLSEGGYLGYFGKASDGMVDVQLISDLFKSEVYAIGRFLGVPEDILSRAPTGDMFDATTDEVVFGAPYDFVELYTHMLWHVNARLMTDEFADEDPASRAQLEEYTENLERMHRYNHHKYLGRSPAVHLDVFDVGVKGGWDNPAWRP